MTKVTVEIDEARSVLYDELVEMTSEDRVQATIEEQVHTTITKLYNNRDRINIEE